MTGLNDFQVFMGTENKLTNQKYMDEVLELCIDPHAEGPVKPTLRGFEIINIGRWEKMFLLHKVMVILLGVG